MSVKIGVNPKDERFYIENRKYFANKEAFIHARIRQDSNSKTTEFEFTGNIVSFVIYTPGQYKLEAWGATGGSSSSTTGAKGAYSRSYVFLEENDEIQILVGEKGGPGG